MVIALFAARIGGPANRKHFTKQGGPAAGLDGLSRRLFVILALVRHGAARQYDESDQDPGQGADANGNG